VLWGFKEFLKERSLLLELHKVDKKAIRFNNGQRKKSLLQPKGFKYYFD